MLDSPYSFYITAQVKPAAFGLIKACRLIHVAVTLEMVTLTVMPASMPRWRMPCFSCGIEFFGMQSSAVLGRVDDLLHYVTFKSSAVCLLKLQVWMTCPWCR